MALNKNHEFEEVNGIKCGIVEKNVKPERVAFLKDLLEFNKYEVVIAPTPPPKVAATPAKPVTPAATQSSDLPQPPIAEKPLPPPPPPPSPPETFTVGVTDITFNPINAIFGRMLKTKDGHIVTLAFWQQKENTSEDEIPYYEHS